MGRCTLKHLGLRRAPSAFALFCRHVQRDGCKWPLQKRLCKKTLVNRKASLPARWRALGPDGQKPFQEERSRLSELVHQKKLSLMKGGADQSPAVNSPAAFCSVLGAMKVKKMLGVGTYGQVWLAHCGATGRPYAIKTCFRHKNGGTGAVDIACEHEILKVLMPHPHIVPAYALVTAEDSQDMGLLLGLAAQALHSHLEAVPLTAKSGDGRQRVRFRIAMQVLSGLEHIHSKRICHLDLKPTNLLVASYAESFEEMHIWIADFGMSRVFPGKVVAGMVQSHPYRPIECRAAPKQQMEVHPSMDVFAYGCLLFDLWQIGRRKWLFPEGNELFEGVPLQAAFGKAMERLRGATKYFDSIQLAATQSCVEHPGQRGSLESVKHILLTHQLIK